MPNPPELYYRQILKALNVSPEESVALFRDAGIELTDEIRDGQRSLSQAEINLLKPLIYRHYRATGGWTRPSAPPSLPGKPRTPAPENRLPADTPAPAPENRPRTPAPENGLPVNSMDALISNHVIMIDTCSLMHPQCETVIRRVIPALQRSRKKIILPEKVLLELKKHSKSYWEPEKAASARKGLKLCGLLFKADCLSVRGSKKDNFADNLFFVQFANYRSRYRMLLITQDNALSRDILQLNKMGSGKGYPVRVLRIDDKGDLKEWKDWEAT